MKKLINESVSRFLGWKLPADFAPDAGITFKPDANTDSPEHLRYKHEPVGTNLFTAYQAEAMLTHVAAPLIDRITELEAQLADAQKDAALGAAIMRACRDLPVSFTLEVNLERGSGDVALFDEFATDVTPNLDDMEFAEKVNAAIDIAVQPKEQAK